MGDILDVIGACMVWLPELAETAFDRTAPRAMRMAAGLLLSFAGLGVAACLWGMVYLAVHKG